jgi:hypothetical protein
MRSQLIAVAILRIESKAIRPAENQEKTHQRLQWGFKHSEMNRNWTGSAAPACQAAK